MNYNSLMNKPTINYRELIGDNTVTEVGGITEEQFNTLLSTDLASYYTKAQIHDLFSRSYVYREKSGSIVTFDCPANVNGIDKVVSEIVAVQDLHGYDSPWLAGAGKNKLQVATTTQTIGGITFTVNSDGTINVNGTATQNITLELSRKSKNGTPLPPGDLILNGCPSGGSTSSYHLTCWRTNSGNANDVGAGRQFSYQSDWDFVVSLVITNGTTCNNLIFKPMIRLATETDSAFAPYSNICPISGWSAVNVVVSPTTDAEDGTTYTTQLKDGQGNPLTCYGGQLSNENGVQSLTLTHGYIASYNGETLPSTWISDRDVYAEGTTPTTGAEVVYTLATPQQISQDSLSIVSTAGTNNLWCDSGDITVKALDKIIQE